jgi:hypothetical protein
MLKLRIALGAFAALILAAGVLLAGENTKSGPQVGEEVPGPFHPLNVTGPDAGEKVCLYCKNGSNPVAMIFAREVSEPLVTLIKKIDTATAQNKDCKMGSFVVFLGDADELSPKLKQVAEKAGLKHTILSVDNPAGPRDYNVSKEADVTVVLYNKHNVKANFAFQKGKLEEKHIDSIVASLSKIVPNQ